ncbi:MmcQ/YjbR family DNA-binding protein [Acidocella facilis]|uniref:MmcQ/YjbR family DNA-binding protein n=1 Tax=Acidocella facilis TaxID=525 RepID=UPI000553F971|nr:MmcQ/YjbR family DNA-binding protein [Acidocella facilis]
MSRLAGFDRFCAKLPGSRMVVQWGESHVHKLGPKVFAIGGGFPGEDGYVFKATPLAFQLLREQGLATRAPYLRRGTWLRVEGGVMSDAELFNHIAQSHRLVAASLTRAQRAELGLG